MEIEGWERRMDEEGDGRPFLLGCKKPSSRLSRSSNALSPLDAEHHELKNPCHSILNALAILPLEYFRRR